MAEKTTWRQTRHKIVFNILRPFLHGYCYLKYGVRAELFKEEGNRPYLILMNHQTGFDQFFVALLFRQPIYYVATEDIFSLGWVSDVIRWLVAPIPIRKQTMDLQAVKNCIKVAREGGSICIAPEGNRTFHGRTVHMNPSIASMAKKLGMPVAILRLEGGYGIQPRWSDVVRRGTMRCYISQVIEPEVYADMTTTELFEMIRDALAVDEGRVSGTFHHRKNAEFLERAIYMCPWCGLSTFESHDDLIRCTKCGREIRHLPTKELEGVGFAFPHRFVADWYDWQCREASRLDLTTLTDAPVWEEKAELRRVHLYKYKELLKKDVTVQLYGDRIILDDRIFPFSQTDAVVVLGKNKINIYAGKDIFQLKGSKRFNAVKYVNFFHRYKNSMAGVNNEQFLGI